LAPVRAFNGRIAKAAKGGDGGAPAGTADGRGEVKSKTRTSLTGLVLAFARAPAGRPFV